MSFWLSPSLLFFLSFTFSTTKMLHIFLCSWNYWPYSILSARASWIVTSPPLFFDLGLGSVQVELMVEMDKCWSTRVWQWVPVGREKGSLQHFLMVSFIEFTFYKGQWKMYGLHQLLILNYFFYLVCCHRSCINKLTSKLKTYISVAQTQPILSYDLGMTPLFKRMS